MNTPTLLDAQGSQSGGTTIVLTVPAGGVPAGATIIIGCSGDVSAPGTTGVADNSTQAGTANTYTRREVPSSGGTVFSALFDCTVTRPLLAGDQITVTWGSSNGHRAANAIVLTDAAAAPFDVSKSAGGNSTSPSSGASAATAQADEMVIGWIGAANVTGQTIAAGTGFTKIGQVNTGNVGNTQRIIAFEYQEVSATGAQTATATLGQSALWTAVVATYKAGKTPVSKTLTASYTVVQQIQKSASASYTVKKPITVILTTPGNTGIIYNVRQQISKARSASYNIIARVGKSVSANYNVHSLPVFTSTPVITGTAVSGNTLHESHSVRADPIDAVTVTRVWQVETAPGSGVYADVSTETAADLSI